MKHFILITALILITGSTFAQSIDSLNQKFETVNLQLDRFHKSHRSGTTVLITGAAITMIGAMMNSTDPEGDGNMFIIGGSGVMAIGGIIQLNSFRHLNPKRRGRGKL